MGYTPIGEDLLGAIGVRQLVIAMNGWGIMEGACEG